MIPLFFISNQPFSGKSSMCVGVGKLFTEKGLKVGYMKPLGTLPTRVGGINTDEDAQYISNILDVKEELEDICPIVLTQHYTREGLKDKSFSKGFVDLIAEAYHRIQKGKDIVILEGAKSVEDGYFLGISSDKICEKLGARVIMVIKYSSEIVDQVLYSKEFLGDYLSGVIINWIPRSQMNYLEELIVPFLTKKGIEVFGYIASDKMLSSVSIKEMSKLLGGQIICAEDKVNELVETFMVGAMGQEQALKFFRRKANKAVITGGDRADVQLAALETPTKCLILTGNFQPSTIVLGRAEELGVPMILVNFDTLTAVEKVGEIIGRVRFHEIKKIDKIVEVVREHIDINRLLEISKK
ncbi:Phosphate acetyltransferase [subsurface metagenome]|nr:AAA family ATPase [Clostridia bacterium]TET15709.1 MAG: phosphotransacetylase family protein [Actinomycetota bacterium]